MHNRRLIVRAFWLLACLSCKQNSSVTLPRDSRETELSPTYADHLEGFWLGQCIANWTGLVTEMDKIGGLGEIRTGAFYTREDWGTADLPNIWSEDGSASPLSPTIDFVFEPKGGRWGADDDTDIEYMYQYLLDSLGGVRLSPKQISDGWLAHMRVEEENYLWVSNQRAFDLMRLGILPPETSRPDSNEHYEMIDAQLTTEIFGLFAPGKPALAIEIADLPIRTVARKNAEWISKFYVDMYARVAGDVAAGLYEEAETYQGEVAPIAERPSGGDRIGFGESLKNYAALAAEAQLPENSYSRAMYTFVKSRYEAGIPWEQARDELYQRYQVEQADGYDLTSKNLYCNGCFAAGINFAASLVSLFWGEGDLKETIKIGTLCGWDSDNPTATWGGLLGFALGRKGVEAEFGRTFADSFWIHRTRRGFPGNGVDNFENMAATGLRITQRVMKYKPEDQD